MRPFRLGFSVAGGVHVAGNGSRVGAKVGEVHGALLVSIIGAAWALSGRLIHTARRGLAIWGTLRMNLSGSRAYAFGLPRGRAGSVWPSWRVDGGLRASSEGSHSSWYPWKNGRAQRRASSHEPKRGSYVRWYFAVRKGASE